MANTVRVESVHESEKDGKPVISAQAAEVELFPGETQEDAQARAYILLARYRAAVEEGKGNGQRKSILC